MLIQLFIHTAKDYTVTHNNYTNTAWPGARGNSNSASSAIASPRSKATKVNYTSSSSSIILHFVKTNLRMLLKLISSEIHKKDEIKLSKSEVDTLRILMRVTEESKGDDTEEPETIYLSESISQISGLFKTNPKVPLSEVYEWISSNLPDKERKAELNIKNLTYCVTIRDIETINKKDIRLEDCEDCYVFFDAPINSIAISN
jgi:hypothetical protein